VLRLDRESLEARLVQLLPGLLESGRCVDLPIHEATTLAVATRIERPQHLGAEPVRLGEDRLGLVHAPRFERRPPQQLPQPELLQQRELHVPEIGLVVVDAVGHGAPS
jgi:hypothetical protein